MQSSGTPVVLVVPDGAADYACDALSCQTPLEGTRRRFALDAIASAGCTGQACPVAPGVACGSDTAHLELLGCNAPLMYSGRGALEARGNFTTQSLPASGVAFKCVLASSQPRDYSHVHQPCAACLEHYVISRRAGGVPDAEAVALLQLIDGMTLPYGSQLHVLHDHSHRAVAVLTHAQLTDHLHSVNLWIDGTDPREDGLCLAHPVSQCIKALGNTDENATGSQERTSEINLLIARELEAADRMIREVLERSQVNQQRSARGALNANTLLFRGAGKLLEYSLLSSEQTGVVTHTKVIAGVARSLGCADVRFVPEEADSLLPMADEAIKVVNSANKQFVLLHVKGTDDAAHAGNAVHKAEVIAQVDAVVERLIYQLRQDAIICCCPDHATPCILQDHTAEPVPVALATVEQALQHLNNPDCISCPSMRFTECATAKGSLGLLKHGRDVNKLMMQGVRSVAKEED